jgi:soluble lytic murein transglycosylase-like protein
MRSAQAVLLALIVSFALPGVSRADQQRDPELKELLQKIIGSADCFTDKYESEVWYKSMEPRLAHFVPTHEERVEILNHVYCEAKRDPSMQIPPDLVLALMEVESRFDRWAVSPNIRMGCEILRYYLRVEHHNWSAALARYNGSVGHTKYPALVMQRWERAWRF